MALQAEQGTPLPEPYLNKPTLEAHLVGVWAAFCTLSNSRPAGLSAGAIPFSEIAWYCLLNGITGETRTDFVELISRTDAQFLRGAREAK